MRLFWGVRIIKQNTFFDAAGPREIRGGSVVVTEKFSSRRRPLRSERRRCAGWAQGKQLLTEIKATAVKMEKKQAAQGKQLTEIVKQHKELSSKVEEYSSAGGSSDLDRKINNIMPRRNC